ncbi:unnamed protein product [Fraxinus pennsylvanica]|uniref:Uncharacterized protein n=1 Tax=Fraxinus pennsylvanica TaxID=56036 RepID=A0AAD2EAI5_9LAMI|nr:unnamed protein product [Fraxinus pennsylvanica]
MIAAISWVPKGASKTVPIVAEPPSKEEIEEIVKSGVMERREDSEDAEDDEDMEVDALMQDEVAHAMAAANALGKASKSTNPETDSIADALKELDMDYYDEEDDGVELFGSGLGNLYYPSNDVDPYLKDNEDDDSEEEEDTTIKPEDAVLVCARNEDDVSHLEVWILENTTDGDSNMYVHHDIIIPAFPLCTAWLDCPLKGGDKGNFVAVGAMDPAIEIWDLDIMDEVQPSFVLGGIVEKKKRGKKKIIKYATGSHTDSVLGLAWNKEYRNILASGSSDKLVKIWDVTTGECNLTMDHHTDKVQAVAWNPFAPQVLLTGSFDHSVVMKDSRIPSHSGFKWSVVADVESLAWDPHTEQSFVVSLENGTVIGFDIRTASSDPKPSFTLHAHDKAVCTVSYNSLVPNLLATGSMDKTVKLWDLTNNKPSCIASQNPKAGAVFSVSFSEDAPFSLAIGGSKGKLQMWDLLSETGVAGRYGKYINELRRRPQS